MLAKWREIFAQLIILMNNFPRRVFYIIAIIVADFFDMFWVDQATFFVWFCAPDLQHVKRFLYANIAVQKPLVHKTVNFNQF